MLDIMTNTGKDFGLHGDTPRDHGRNISFDGGMKVKESIHSNAVR